MLSQSATDHLVIIKQENANLVGHARERTDAGRPPPSAPRPAL